MMLTETEVREALARGYIHESIKDKVTDPVLVEAMTKEIMAAQTKKVEPASKEEMDSNVKEAFDQAQQSGVKPGLRSSNR